MREIAHSHKALRMMIISRMAHRCDDLLLTPFSVSSIALSSRPSTSAPEHDQPRSSSHAAYGHLLPPISAHVGGLAIIRCLSGRERLSQKTDYIASPRFGTSLPLSCPTTPLAPTSLSESTGTNLGVAEQAGKERSSPAKKKKRKGKKRKSNTGDAGISPKPPPGPPTSSSPRPLPVAKQFERLYHKEDASKTLPKRSPQDPRSPLTPTITRNVTPLRSVSLVLLGREAQNDTNKPHVDKDGAKAKAQERLEQYRRAQEQAAVDLQKDEEMKRGKRKEIRVAMDLAKQRQREEVYAVNRILALSEAARMKLILMNPQDASSAGEEASRRGV